MYESTGILRYDPDTHLNQMNWRCILKVDSGLMEYYQAQLMKLFDVRFSHITWGPHITVINAEEPKRNRSTWGKLHNEPITFSYSPDIYLVESLNYFCISIICPTLNDLREWYGLSPKPSKGELHFTIGKVDKRHHQQKCKGLQALANRLGVASIASNYKLLPLVKLSYEL